MHSTTTALFSLARVAADAGIPRSTLYDWLTAEPPIVVTELTLTSLEREDTPLFTDAQRRQIVRLAQERSKVRDTARDALASLRLQRSGT